MYIYVSPSREAGAEEPLVEVLVVTAGSAAGRPRTAVEPPAGSPTLSQRQFLGSKYFTILHENVRDIALKMYRL